MPTVTAFAQELADEYGENYADSDTAEQIQKWVSEVINEIYSAGRWNFSLDTDTLNLVNGTRTYDLDADTVEISSVLDASGGEIVYVPLERLIARALDVHNELGTPEFWYYAGVNSSTQARKVGFYPIPDGSYALTLHVFLRPGALAASTQIPLPYEFLQPLRDGVRAKVKANDGHTQEAQVYDQRYQQGIGLLTSRLHGGVRGPSRLGITMLPQHYQAPGSTTGG